MQLNRRKLLAGLAALIIATAGFSGTVAADDHSSSLAELEAVYDSVKEMESYASDAEDELDLGNYDDAYAYAAAGENAANDVKDAIDAAEDSGLTAEELALLSDAEDAAKDAADHFDDAMDAMEDGNYDAAEDSLKLAKETLDEAADTLDSYID